MSLKRMWIILLISEGNKWISYDGGKTFEKTNDYVIYGSNQIKLPAGLKFTVGDIEVDTDEGVYIGVQSIKPDRDNYPNWTTYQAFLYTENLGKKTSLGVMPTAEYTYYASPLTTVVNNEDVYPPYNDLVVNKPSLYQPTQSFINPRMISLLNL